MVRDEADMHISSNDSCNNSKVVQHSDKTTSYIDKGSDSMVDQCCPVRDGRCGRHSDPMGVSISGPQAALEENADTPIDSANVDFILEAARIIEVKQKKIAELSIQKCPAENHMISHWGFVLEEMVWLANDFAQEHLWKISAAAQFCRLAAFRSQPRCGQQNKHWESKNLAHSMAKAIMQFWHSVEHSVDNDDPGCVEISVSVESGKELSKDSEGQCPGNIVCFKLLAYASRFLKYNNSLGISSHPYAVQTPERVSVSSDVDMSWDELHTEENLFYTVPPMAFDTYRKSVESHFLQWEKSGSGTQEEVETSLYDPSADADSEEIAYDEDEGESDAYYLHARKKHRTMKSYAQEFRDQYTAGTRPSMQFGRKRDRLNFGSVPMKGKRRRMASRQRVVPTYAQRWKLDSVLSEQRGLSQKRSYGSSGLYRQHNGKKLKIVKPSFDNNLDNASLMTNSIPSLAASQMSYMSNLSKSFKTAKGRNAKTFKISSGQSVSGRPWSSFEEQAVLLLVHNLGPHWELISDAINSIFPLKYIFREPKECKEHYKFLMDDNAGDGADSAEDSESSYPCPSLICGIPKFERQVFHHFLGPMEEDIIKSHLEKIIKIGKKYDHHLNQNNNQAIKQIHIVDNSHFVALSQVFPNNLNGNVLTPRDFCDINSPAADSLPHGHQCSHARDLLLSNQGSVPSVLPTSGASSSLPGSSGMVHLNKLFSPSGPAGASSRFGVSRTLSVHEQQRVQQFSQVSSKNVKQSSVSVSGSLSGSERNVNMSSIKLNNQLVKQRHRQPQQQPQPQQHQQPGRQHYNPRQHPLPHHQTTVVKGIGGGSISLSRIPPMSQTADKGDKIMSHPQTAVSSKICSSGDLQLQSKGMNQNQPNVQRMLHLNFPLHSESSRKPQSDSMQAVQPSEHNASQVSTGTPVTPVQQSSSQPILSQHQYQLQEQHQEDQDQHSPKLGTSDCQPR